MFVTPSGVLVSAARIDVCDRVIRGEALKIFAPCIDTA